MGCWLLLAALPAWPAGQEGGVPRTVRLPVTRDAWFSDVGAERDGNNGAAARLKIKGHQELTLLDIDPAPLRGRIVTKAALHVRLSGPERLRRVTVSSFNSPWTEGTGTGYAVLPGASTFRLRRHPDLPWAWPGSDLTAVTLGQGGSRYASRDAGDPDKDGWQAIPVDPAVVMARTAGVSQGFLVFDDTGSEWTRDGEKWTTRLLPNRFFYSRDQNAASAPYFTVELDAADAEPPAAPRLSQQANRLALDLATPADDGAVAFEVQADGQPLPAWRVPRPGSGGRSAVLSVDPGVKEIAVVAIDGAGNRSPPARIAVQPSPEPEPVEPLPPPAPAAAAPDPRGLPAKLGGATVAILDELERFDPRTGTLIPPAADAAVGLGFGPVSLRAARNETIGFQVLLRGEAADVTAAVDWTEPGRGQPIATRLGEYVAVGTPAGPLPDPLPELAGPLAVRPDRPRSIHVEFFVPKDAKPGRRRGSLRLAAGADSLELPIELTVWRHALPDQLTFIPEMNAYGLPDDNLDYYRLAHRRRTELNVVPYNQRGEVQAGWAPRREGQAYRWEQWDRKFGPLLDGSAFKDGPRAGTPVAVFYLPPHENWPARINDHYNGSYWADQAFTPEYRQWQVQAAAAFARHLSQKRWHGTLFQFFLNNKCDFKRNGWSRGSSPWLLDEPANFHDFLALRYFAKAYREGWTSANPTAQLAFRADISRPQWQRDTLDGLLDYLVVSSAFRQYRPLVLERKARDRQKVLEYGTAPAVEQSAFQPVAWCIDVWSLGGDGVVPWQTIATPDAWKTGEETGLLYRPRRPGEPPTPSLRLVAFERGQQWAEQLHLLAGRCGQDAAQGWIRGRLDLAATRGPGGVPAVEDAGRVSYGKLSPARLAAVRRELGDWLSAAHREPAP